MHFSYSDFLLPRHNWKKEELENIITQPFNDLIRTSHEVHRKKFPNNEVQLSTLLNIKAGACPEDCRYCSQSAHYKTDVSNKSALMDISKIEESIREAKEIGAQRFCFAAAWRSINNRHIDYICSIIKIIKKYELESCASLGMITDEQAIAMKNAGLDYYNHNIDTSREHYKNIVTTRCYNDRLKTLAIVANSDIKICCGGILGIGESDEDRLSMILEISNLPKHPMSFPINMLVPIKGTPMIDKYEKVSSIDFIKIVALSRLVLPETYIRLAAGRSKMSEEMEAICFFAGANSIFIGEKLLTTPNSSLSKDKQLFTQLGIAEVAKNN